MKAPRVDVLVKRGAGDGLVGATAPTAGLLAF